MPKADPANPEYGKFEYRISAAHNGTAEVFLYGDIGESWDGESITAKNLVMELAAIEADNISARINSFGGSVPDGLAIYNAFRRHPAKVTMTIDAQALSIASLIAMAGDELFMSENALMMIHAPWTFAIGNSSVMREVADVLDNYATAMSTSYAAARPGKMIDDIIMMLKDGRDHWFTAQEAFAEGWIDGIIDASEEKPRLAAKTRFKIPGAIAAQLRKFDTEKANMPKSTIPAAADDPVSGQSEPQATPQPNVAEIEKAAEAKAAARIADRNKGIHQSYARFFAKAGVRDLYDECITDASITVEAAREKLLAKLGEGAEPLAADPVISSGMSDREKFIQGASQALLARTGAAQHDRANPYRGMRMHEIAKAALQRAGVKVDGETPEEFASKALNPGMVRGAQTTSDFPVILENTLHKMVLTGFQAQQPTWQRICKIGDVTDFRQWQRIVPGLLGNLDGVNEAGEYLNKNIPDGVKNPIQATRKGNIINLTPETLVNDDIGYLQDMATGLGAAGGRAIERAVYVLLESNPTMSDTKALFHADHGNLAGSGAAPTMLLIDSAAAAMAVQTAPGDDAEYLDIIPAVGLVNRALRGQFAGIIDALYDPDTANKLQKPNIVRGMVDVVSTPRIAAAPWYLFADPMVAPVLEVVFLNGQREPRLTMEENFRTSGLAWKVELPFGVGAIDYRGAYKNPGV